MIPIIVAQQIVQEQGARSVNVPIEAHILAVADAYQKLISGANGKALSPQQAEEEIIAGAGQKFHTGVVDAFAKAIGRTRPRARAPINRRVKLRRVCASAEVSDPIAARADLLRDLVLASLFLATLPTLPPLSISTPRKLFIGGLARLAHGRRLNRLAEHQLQIGELGKLLVAWPGFVEALDGHRDNRRLRVNRENRRALAEYSSGCRRWCARLRDTKPECVPDSGRRRRRAWPGTRLASGSSTTTRSQRASRRMNPSPKMSLVPSAKVSRNRRYGKAPAITSGSM